MTATDLPYDLPDDLPDQGLMRRCPSFADAERLARSRLPAFLEGYLSGASDGEEGLLRNRRAFEAITLTPRYGIDVEHCDPSTTLLGKRWAVPVGVAPVGYGGSFWPDCELHLARAAARHNLPFIASTVSVRAIEEIAAAGSGNVWFQLYVVDEQAINEDLLKRSSAAGIDTLVVTVDVPLYSKRNRDLRNAMSFPFHVRPVHLWHMAVRPAWTLATLSRRLPTIANFLPYIDPRKDRDSQLADIIRQRNPATWEQLAGLRRRWPGKLLVKGILEVGDARQCVAAGADGIIVSNHGARQFDAAPAAIDALPAIVDAIADRAAVIVDSGIRGGYRRVARHGAGGRFLPCRAALLLDGRRLRRPRRGPRHAPLPLRNPPRPGPGWAPGDRRPRGNQGAAGRVTRLSCPHLLRASMNTLIGKVAPAVAVDCRDEPGNDKVGGGASPTFASAPARCRRRSGRCR